MIVVLLLIATLIALLIFYLRTRNRLDSSPAAAAGGFSNETYESAVSSFHIIQNEKGNHCVFTVSNEFIHSFQEDRVVVPSVQNHPMEAGFNNVSVSMLFMYDMFSHSLFKDTWKMHLKATENTE